MGESYKGRSGFLNPLYKAVYKGKGWLTAAFVMAAGFATSGCVAKTAPPPVRLKATTFDKLPGWQSDKHSEVLRAFAQSCARILRESPTKAFSRVSRIGGKYGDWQPACEALKDVPPGDDARAREYFEKWFRPWSVTGAKNNPKGLFTGYYEAALNGSRTKSDRYRYPLLRMPPDLKEGQFTRRDIMEGNWPHDTEKLAIVWVDNVVDLVFLQIQGSGRVEMDDGTSVRVEYAGQNGQRYYAIGKELVKQGHMKLEDVTMQSIREWLTNNPDKALDIIYADNSYVFFREAAMSEGPRGAEGVSLTPERSLAIDRRHFPFGMPIWLDADEVLAGEGRIQRLVVGQDTGGAIRIENGRAARGDFFWGYGARAEQGAGHMKAEGQYWFLLPKHLKR